MKKYIAELIGTFALVFLGCSAIVVSSKLGLDVPAGIGLLGIALAFGLTVASMAYAIGPISGCHVNPAVTIGVLVAGRMKAADAVGYIVAQFIGATLGAFVLYQILHGMNGFSMGEWALGANGYGAGWLKEFNTTSAFLTEAILTFLFVFVILATTSKQGNSGMAGLIIGLTLVIIHLAGIPITGASVNPARSFGPAIFAGGKAMQQLWLYLIAPVTGAIISALVWKMVFEKE
jgi:aquaporin Z